MDITIYDKIFDTAQGKMQEHGMDFSFDYQALNCVISKNPNVIEGREFLDMSQERFLNALYFRGLNKLPTEKTYRRMQKYMQIFQSDIAAKYLIFVNVSHRARFHEMAKSICDLRQLKQNVFARATFQQKILLIKYELIADVKFVVQTYIVFPIWRRLTEDNQKKIRAIIKREKRH